MMFSVVGKYAMKWKVKFIREKSKTMMVSKISGEEWKIIWSE